MNALDLLLRLPQKERSARGLAFTPIEISQQPKTWRLSRAAVENRTGDLRQFLGRAGIGPPVAATVRLIGAGTSDHVAQSVRALIAKRWQCEVAAVPSTELLTDARDWIVDGRPYLWIWFSRSGDTPEAVAGLDRALAACPAINHIVITCNAVGQLAHRFCGDTRVFPILLDDSVNDRGLAMTSSFSNMVIAAQAIAHIDFPATYDRPFEALTKMADGFRRQAAELCASLASQGYSKLCFLGTGALNAVAHECALKVLELTAGRVHTLAYSSLGVRHGPLSALDGDTMVISFLSNDRRRRGYETDLLSEIRAKGLARIIVAIAPTLASIDAAVDEVLRIDTRHCADDYRPPVDVIFGQLLGLFLSLEHGLKPDNPSPNGAISRVVSSVRIHLE